MPAKATACKTCGAPDLVRGRALCATHYAEHQAHRYRMTRDERLQYARRKHAETVHRRLVWRLQARYGLTWDDFVGHMVAQSGRCAICLTAFADGGKDGPYVDHCHEGGQVRGLLCRTCNLAVGQFGDDPDRLRQAALYLLDAALA